MKTLVLFLALALTVHAQHESSPVDGIYSDICSDETQFLFTACTFCPFCERSHPVTYVEVTCPLGDPSIPAKCGMRHFAGICWNFDNERMFSELTIDDARAAVDGYDWDKARFIELSMERKIGEVYVYEEMGDVIDARGKGYDPGEWELNETYIISNSRLRDVTGSSR